MITAALSRTIDQLPPEEYTMVEQYVNSIADMVAKHQKAKAWDKIKTDLIASEKSVKEERTVIVAELYDYREDYANQFFHGRTTNDEADHFWDG